jgi:hypothetical protein
MVVWGGAQCSADCPTLNTGGRYDPANDVWTSTSMTNAPGPRYAHATVWSGNVMIVWSGTSTGFNPGPLPYSTGAAYHPWSDSWTATSLLDAPTPRFGHTAVWVENEMIVWGGAYGGYLNSGGRYGPIVPTYYHDSDGDGHGDPNAPLQTFNPPPAYVASADDCSDTDSSSWATPSEVRDLRLTDPITLAWSAPSQPGGVSLAYDSIRSSEPFDFISAATCVASDIAILTCTDAEVPVRGQIHFYLVRAQNGCPQGQGPAGSDSNGVSRAARSCP